MDKFVLLHIYIANNKVDLKNQIYFSLHPPHTTLSSNWVQLFDKDLGTDTQILNKNGFMARGVHGPPRCYKTIDQLRRFEFEFKKYN